jgi:hypothetical protein
MNLNENISRVKKLMGIIFEEYPKISTIRRLPKIRLLLDVFLNNSNPCDYENSEHFMYGVLNDLEIYFDLYDIEDFDSVKTKDVYNFIKDNMKDIINQYYLDSQEDC